MHPRLNLTHLKIFLPLIEAYVEFKEYSKLQELITKIKDTNEEGQALNTVNLVFLAFISEYYGFRENSVGPISKIQCLNEQEEM